LPCGNGLLGMLLWGDGDPLNLSVDRSDLWDNRPDPRTRDKKFRWKQLVEFIDRNDMKSVADVFEHSGADTAPYPTKVPCGRVTLNFGKKNSGSFDSRLNLAKAMTFTRIDKTLITAYVHAEKPLMVVRVRHARPRVDFLSPFDKSRQKTASSEGGVGPGEVAKLNYPPLERQTHQDDVESVFQRCAEGASYAVAWTSSNVEREWILYLTIQQANKNQDPIPRAREVLEEAKSMGPVSLEKSHVAWWRKYWSKGHVNLPETRLEKLWYAEMYKLAATAREDAPPISLQGVWTADEMSLPPWRGDYHHDLNTQMTYWPVHTANRLEQSKAFADWLLKWLPAFQAFARDFYDAPGANVPCAHGLSGAIVRGWAAYVYSRTNGAWLTQHLWLHYRYTMDKEFLKTTAYPFIREIARFCASQVTRDAAGIYHIDYSSSPEFNGNRRESFARDSTYDLSLIRYVLDVAGRSAKLLGTDQEIARQWQEIKDHLQPYPISPGRCHTPSPERGLALWEGQGLTESHRHFAHLMPVFPLGDVNIEGSERDRELIQNSLCELEAEGSGFWCGYSFGWLACLAARIREPNRVLWALSQYLDAFVSPNSFHLNGDYKKSGASRFHYRPFTLEGNFAAGHAINEMLLQSWGDRIRLFPSVPAEWRDVAFTDLRAEGAFLISAWRKNGEVEKAEILAEKGGTIRLEHPHSSKSVVVRKIGETKRRLYKPGQDISFETRAGERYVLMGMPPVEP